MGVKETTLHVNSFNAWKNRPIYNVPAEYGRFEDFSPILEKEVAVIVDEKRWGVVLEEVMKQMEDTRKPVVTEHFGSDIEIFRIAGGYLWSIGTEANSIYFIRVGILLRELFRRFWLWCVTRNILM